MAPLIEFRNVYKYFGGLCAINNVSLRVARGEVIGLVGDNAAGKSTLMKIISGVHRPTRGQLLVEGRPVEFRSPRDAREAGVEMVFQIQDPALVPDLGLPWSSSRGASIFPSGPFSPVVRCWRPGFNPRDSGRP